MIFVIKTVDGAELVGEMSDSIPEGSYFTVKDPLEVIYQYNEMTGSTGATFQKYNTFSKTESVLIFKHSVITVYPANETLVKAHADTLAAVKKEKMGEYEEDKRESLKETLASMLEKLSSNTTVH
jgi:hypothetical protein